jgi:cytochrome c biogenesis protein CcmG/thiol:disulfide interchange protein DsbE
MNKRWILVLTAAVGIGLLAVPLFIKRSAPPPAAETASAEPPSLSSKASPACRPSSRAKLHLTDYKGKVVLLNFWATWCGPCKVEIPEFVELYSQYKDRGFVILGVLSQDTPSKDQLQAFLTENKMEYPILYSSEKLESAFDDLWALPTTFLISRDGAMCAKQLGPASKEDVERSLKALL